MEIILPIILLLAIQTSACLLLILNVRGIYKGSRRAIIYAFISIILIASATIYTYASFYYCHGSLSYLCY